MTHENRDRKTNTEVTDDRPISYTPGRLEDKESASARANRTQQKDSTSLTPEGAVLREGGAEQLPGEHGDTRQAQQEADGSTEHQPDLGTSADPLR